MQTIILKILKIHFGEIRNEQSPYHVPGSKCKQNQREKLHIHIQKKKIWKSKSKKKQTLFELGDGGFHLASAIA